MLITHKKSFSKVVKNLLCEGKHVLLFLSGACNSIPAAEEKYVFSTVLIGTDNRRIYTSINKCNPAMVHSRFF